MNLTEWVDQLVVAFDVDLDVDIDGLLEVARTAAHSVDRPAAPLTTFLIGYAAAQRGEQDASVAECIEIASTLASAHSDDA